AHGLDLDRLPCDSAQLAAQIADVDVEDVRVAVEVGAPDRAEQVRAREDLARAAEQLAGQRILARGQAELAVGADQHSTATVDGDRTGAEQIELAGAAAVQGLEPGEQLGEREGLDQIVVGAGLEPGDALADAAAGGQHQHGCAQAGVAPATKHAGAVEIRQHPVEDDRVVVDVAGLAERLLAAGAQVDAVTLFAQALDQDLGQAVFVFDEQ